MIDGAKVQELAGQGVAEISEHPGSKRSLTVIKPSRGWGSLGFRDFWHHRDLLYFLVWRDLKVRYKQTVFGAAWAVLQPLLMMLVFTVFFSHLVKISFGGTPYAVASYTGLIPWTLFSSSVVAAAASIVQGGQLISKVYFPRLLVPIAAGGSYVLDFLIASVLLIGLMAYYRIHPTSDIVYLPLLALLAIAAALSVGVWLAALNVRYRDVNYAVPFLIQVWMFATPIAYPITYIPERWRVVYGLNPMVGVVEGFRWALLGTSTHPGWTIAVSAAVVVLLLLGGMAYFKHTEREFADIL